MAPRRCKNGKVKSGARKGLCRKRPLSGAAKRGGRKGPLRGAAARAKQCKGQKGADFRACLKAPATIKAGTYSTSASGKAVYTPGAMYGIRRRRKSRR
jgi:hypothetical protein